MRRGLLCLELLLGCSSFLFPEASLDDPEQVFGEPPPDANTAQPAEPNPVDQLTFEPGIRFRGSYSAYVGFLLGWAQFPDSSDLENGFTKAPAFGISASISFEARPNAKFRVLGTLIENFPNTSMSPVSYKDITPPTFAELFCDYSIVDLFFLRIQSQRQFIYASQCNFS